MFFFADLFPTSIFFRFHSIPLYQDLIWNYSNTDNKPELKAMVDIGVAMTPFGDVVTVILVANSYVFVLTQGVGHAD